jgi:hypothetical protein
VLQRAVRLRLLDPRRAAEAALRCERESEAAVPITAAARGFLLRFAARRRHAAATAMQRVFRAHLARRRVRTLLKGAWCDQFYCWS